MYEERTYQNPPLKGLQKKQKQNISFDKNIKPNKLYEAIIKIKCKKGTIKIGTLITRPKRKAITFSSIICLNMAIREQISGKITKYEIVSIQKQKTLKEKEEIKEKGFSLNELEGEFEITPGPRIIKNGEQIG